MRCEYTEAGEETVAEIAASVAAESHVEALFVLVGESAAFTPTANTTASNPATWDVDVPFFGGVFPEVIHAGVKTGNGVVVVGLPVLPDVQTVTGLDDNVGIVDQLDPTVLERDHETAFVLVDSYASRVGEFVNRLFDTYGVEITFVGGGTGRLDETATPSLFTDEGLLDAGAIVTSTPLSGSLGVRHGWEEVAGPLRVTDSDGRTVQTLDGEPAFDQYSKTIADHTGSQVDPDNFFDSAKAYPFGISRVGGEVIVRDPYQVHEDGSIDCFGAVPEGEFVHILHGNADKLVSAAHAARGETVDDDEDSNSGRDAVQTEDEDETVEKEAHLFFFDCISRVLYLEDEFSRELAVIGSEEEPMVGALTIGEIANDGRGHLEYYNKTAVVASLTE